MSRVLVRKRVGGNPCKSAYNVESPGSRGSVLPTYSPMNLRPGCGGDRAPATPVTVYTACVSPGVEKSPVVEKMPSAAGSGRFNIFNLTANSPVRIAPADAPYTTMCSGL